MKIPQIPNELSQTRLWERVAQFIPTLTFNIYTTTLTLHMKNLFCTKLIQKNKKFINITKKNSQVLRVNRRVSTKEVHVQKVPSMRTHQNYFQDFIKKSCFFFLK